MPPPRLPFLDALLGGEDEPAWRGGPARRGALLRDLALLFGTRPRRRSAPEDLVELRTSVLAYGIPDLRTRPVNGEAGREALRAELETRLRRFEPRLASATVEGPEDDGRRLRFRVRGVVTDADPEPVAFDVDLDVATRSLSVSDASDGGG